MSEPFLKSLECSCIKGTSATCPGGGELSASLGLKEGALFANIDAEALVVSPPEKQTVSTGTGSNPLQVIGSGPLYQVRFLTFSDEDYTLQDLEGLGYGWRLVAFGPLDDGEFTGVGEYIVLDYLNDGSLLVEGVLSLEDSTDPSVTSGDIPIEDVLADPESIFSARVFGFGNPTLPRVVPCKSFAGAILEADADLEMIFSSEIPLGFEGFSPDQTGRIQHDFDVEGEIYRQDLVADYSVGETFTFEGELEPNYTDKVGGQFGDFYCEQKMYPSGDLAIEPGFGNFVGPFKESNELYSLIDEGVYEGILQNGGDSITLSDDTDWIQPDTIHTEGLFQYKCALTEFRVRPEHSSFRIRVATPLVNYESKTAPLYTVYNIHMMDPSGNTIVKYGDIQIRGDSTEEYPNFATYSSLPVYNAVNESYDFQRVKPYLHEVSGYKLSFSVRAVSLDDPFDPGFDPGFEENYILPDIFSDEAGNNYLALDGQPLSTHETRFLNPTRGFKVASLEICNSGGFGPRIENAFNVYMEVPEKGKRLERCIKPNFMHLYDYDTSIYPALTNNTWVDDNNIPRGETFGASNEDECGAEKLVDIIRQKDTDRFIKLQTAEGGGVADSGKLLLRFGGCGSSVDEITPGAFNLEFDQGTKNIWWSPSGAFNVENRRSDIQRDSIYYDIDSLTLKVLAKKEPGTRDYVLDVVGYSDDKLLNVTSPSGGFIQDPSGVFLNDQFIPNVGTHPVLSGFYGDDFALSEQSLSEMDDYFEGSGNDHYRLTQYPVVTGTDFEWYEVPLVILDDDVRLGLSSDYSVSSLLERVYLDIYPIPSGASVAYVELCTRYAPANGLNLYTQGGEKVGKVQDGRSEAALFPTSRGAVDDYLNTGSGYQPISHLRGLPHTYSSPETIKTNYSRRWRGVEGTVRGPYDPDMFSFGFENPVIDYPFLSGYYKFDNLLDGFVQSTDLGPRNTPSGLGTASGELVGSPKVYQNLGWRFSQDELFTDHLPGFSGNYTSTDWTALSNGSNTFVGNPMYGKIADAFDRVVRISGEAGDQKIDFGTIDTVSGFAIFLRFTPDSNVSGVGYDLFESGVLASQWDTPTDMGWVLGYEGGFLTAWAQDSGGAIVSIQDTANYYDYTYPLSVLLTYNDNYSKKLKLYTDSEDAAGMWDTLRDESTQFFRNENSAPIVLGHSDGSGVGMNMLVSEFGISAYSSGVNTLYGSGTNIVESNSDWTYKQVTADDFFENVRSKYFNPGESADKDRYKLWDRVNEDTFNDWAIGDFKYCEFGMAFDQWQKRPNAEQIVFDIKHHGSGYNQSNDLPMLSNVNSGVAYHTQIENDFLRFHLSDVPNSFYSVNRRISKNLPCGYDFAERALVVETVLEHKAGSGIKWTSCDDIVPSGPKMIVSLYTKKQDPYWTPDEPNWGLVNRKVHYIKPSSCVIRLDSTFDYEDLCEETEEWAIFPKEPRLKDFKERYFTDDVNQMFVQYDLVYPSGPPFESRLYMHSSHVRMADANICAVDSSGSMNLNVSGAFPASSQINLNVGGFPREVNDSLDLTIQVPFPYDTFDEGIPSGFHLNISGAIPADNSLNLLASAPGSGYAYFNLNVSGLIPPEGSGAVNLVMPETIGVADNSPDQDPNSTPGASLPNGGTGGGGRPGGGGGSSAGGGPGSILGIPLTVYNAEVTGSPDGPVLNMSLLGHSDEVKGLSQDVLFQTVFNNQTNTQQADGSGVVNLSMFGLQGGASTRAKATMPMVITAPNIVTNDLPLVVYNPIRQYLESGSLNLVTASYEVGGSIFGSPFGSWFNNNYGTGIKLTDNHVAALPVDNEIRGVDLTAYGSCTGDSPSKAIDAALFTDCTVWREETCNDGGIFRAKETYTNSGALYFDGTTNNDLGYSGNYYGIRKYTQLIPSVPYRATMTIKTGSTDEIPVPRTFEEWEYGMCGPAWYDDGSGCCTENCLGNVVFSGVKFVGDDTCGVPPSSNLCVDPALILESGRKTDAKFGWKTMVKEDLMAVSSPNLTIPDFSPYDQTTIDVSGAGAVFLYRRDQDIAGEKAKWGLIEPLMLPTGFRKDYIQRTTENLLTFDQFSISGNKWQIGQEGRLFGESLDMAVSGDREVVVVGAPRAGWKREFADLTTSGIPTAGMLFVDLFDYSKPKLRSVAGTAEKFNILWKYFSAPWKDGDEGNVPGPGDDVWYSEIAPKLIILQLTYSNIDYPVIPRDESAWFVHRYIPRLDDLDLLLEEGSAALGGIGSDADFVEAGKPIVFNQQFSGVMDAFFTAWPKGNPSDALYSGIPAILGMFKEQTGSTAGALRYVDSNGDLQDIYEKFENFYLSHSFESGVFDFVQGIRQSGHLNTVVGKSEEWDIDARSLLEDTFDSGRLSTTFTNTTLNRNFVTSGVGQEWGDTHGTIVSEFQIPPASGGRVYIFENERGNFNCTQVIISPNDTSDLTNEIDIMGANYYKQPNERFGHAVAISRNGEVLALGNPFTPTPCRIYERNEDENQKVYDRIRSWCVSVGKTDAIGFYDDILAQSGAAVAKTATYDFINASDRFAYRNDVNFWDSSLPTPYALTYRYRYSDIQYVGTRKFLPSTFAPTSRLGWSASVDDNGEICAFGAPTDSFNQFEDVNVWGDDLKTWASYQHAGAVRVFQNRKYYPHDKVIEFSRFGNLDRSMHPSERNEGYYDEQNWPLIFASGADGTEEYQGKDWRRTEFSEIEIPRDAGLAFIITPELDAASDEIIQNIKDWLALGDRNLVLVGNDPIWEENGLYKDSNDIINKILEKLGSRMRIYPAKDKSYAFQGVTDQTPERLGHEGQENGACITQGDINADLYNITRSFLPTRSTGRSISDNDMYAKGVGDIRIDLTKDGLEDYYEEMICPEGQPKCGNGPPSIINTRCNFPLQGVGGDLRAEWIEQCIKTTPKSCKEVKYRKNWPLQFENYIPNCDDPPDPLFKRGGFEPVPVLTTMEHLPPSSWYEPATSGLFCDWVTLYKWKVNRKDEKKVYLAEHNINELAFGISGTLDDDVDGIFNSFRTYDNMFNPEPTNGRDGIIQATGYPDSTTEERNVRRTVYPESILALVESGRDFEGQHNNSQVFVMASQWSEDNASRGITAATLNDDKNTEFYINMIKQDCIQAPKGIQINAFTGRSSLKDAYHEGYGDDSVLHNLGSKLNVEFLPGGGFFRENQEFSALNDLIDFVWLACPTSQPSDQQLSYLREWMNLGNKKIIITYNSALPTTRNVIADNITYLLDGLDVTSRPMYLPRAGEFFLTGDILYGYNRPDAPSVQRVDTTTEAISGCHPNGYEFTGAASYYTGTSLSGVEFSPQTSFSFFDGSEGQGSKRQFIPLSGGQDFEKIVWFDDDIKEEFTEYSTTNFWKMDGGADMTFPLEPGSGYRMWITWVSETPFEKLVICGEASGVNIGGGSTVEGAGEGDDFGDGSFCQGGINLTKTSAYTPVTVSFDFFASGDTFFGEDPSIGGGNNLPDEFGLIFDTSRWTDNIPTSELENTPLPPKTPRLLSVSGALLPIITEINVTTTSGLVPTGGYYTNCRYEVNPAQSGEIPGESRPVKHPSEIYCPPGGFGDDDCDFALEDWKEELIEDGPVVCAEEFENFSSFPAGRRRSKIIVISDSTIVQGQCPQYRAQTLSGNQVFIRSLYPPSPSEALDPDEAGGFGGPDSNDGLFGSSNEIIVEGKNWEFTQKLRGPERGSPAKYASLSGSAITNPSIINPAAWGGGGPGAGALSSYVDNEDSHDPATLSRPDELKTAAEIEKRKEDFNDDDVLGDYGMWTRFSGDFLDIVNYQGGIHPDYDKLLNFDPDTDRDFIVDAGIGGGMNELMKINNTDYLDLDIYNSGSIGDLFGYSIDLSNNRLAVGTPFNAFYTEGAISGVSGIVQWHEVINDPERSGIKIGYDGGAGAAFVFDQTGQGQNVVAENLAWEFTAKLKPSNINVGIYDFSAGPINAVTQQRGTHQIQDADLALEYGKRGDMFGYSVALDCDMVAVGAPHHDYETLHHHIYSGAVVPNELNTAFTRKDFNASFDIPQHSFYDLADNYLRETEFGGNSGLMILGGGAVYNYRYELTDFARRQQQWQFAEKLYAVGYNDRVQTEYTDILGTPYLSVSGSESDRFGWSVSIDRARRGDSDYTLSVGSPFHDWPTSGNHPTSGLVDAGSAYTFDCMLREQIPAIPASSSWIDAHVFGNKLPKESIDRLETRVYQNLQGGSKEYAVSGIIFSNSNGDIFLEVSGYDASSKGFIAHRPYVDNIYLELLTGQSESAAMNLVASGRPVPFSGEMPLAILGADRANVYNSIDLNMFGVEGIASGEWPSGLSLNITAPSGPVPGTLNLIAGSTQTTNSLDLRIRGF